MRLLLFIEYRCPRLGLHYNALVLADQEWPSEIKCKPRRYGTLCPNFACEIEHLVCLSGDVVGFYRSCLYGIGSSSSHAETN